jgi:lipopolysaccharide/colanic/teichoic acid biosynthesis glycosyltransferase
VKGEMSLVGPRPEAENVVARYDAHHRRRLKAKPGLTGLQQVVARGSTDLDERVRLDVYYIRRRTLLYDVWLLLRTPWAALRGHGAV